MPRLIVDGFSSIGQANLELSPLTLLVGPQASGKSLLSKLFYFFNDTPRILVSQAQDGETLRAARDRLKQQFKEWFPPSAWGPNRFVIQYVAGSIRYEVQRSNPGSREPSNDIDITLSKFISEEYSSLLKEYSALSRYTDFEDNPAARHFSGPRYDLERQFYRRIQEAIGHEYVQSQVFIPAGRSFFTNLGKAFAILEHGRGMNYVLSRFGSLYAFMVDLGSSYYVPNDRASRDAAKASQEKRQSAMRRLFGGQIRLGTNKQFLQTGDGRQVPFALLSSGQQELLPLWLTVSHFARSMEFLP